MAAVTRMPRRGRSIEPMAQDDISLQVDELRAARRSLRIALVTETYPPEVNGVARTLHQVVEGLRARHHDLQLVRPRQQPSDAADVGDRFHEVLMRGLAVPRYPQLRMGMPARRALVKLWTLNRPDLVHIATEGPLGWSGLQAARHLRLPVASDFRTNFHAYSRHYGVGWLNKPIVAYLKRFHNHCQVTMVPTRSLMDELSGYGFRNLRVLGRGVDTTLFNPARRSEALRAAWGAAPDTLVLLHVGRIAPEKNLDAVVRTFQALLQQGRDVKLVFVGDGPSRPAIAEQLPQAVFAGMQGGESLATHYASGDVFLFPSLTETFGNVTPEALASGLAVVACDCAAAAQIIRPGRNGHLVAPEVARAGGFAASTLAWLGDPEADNAVWHCGSGVRRAARQTALELGWDAVLDGLESTLFGLVRGNGDGGGGGEASVPLAGAWGPVRG